MAKQDEQYARAEQVRQRAIADRDLTSYVFACEELGITPESEVREALSFGLSPQQQEVLRGRLEEVGKRVALRKKYSALLIFHKEHNVNLERLGEGDLKWMRRGLINVMGYTRLKGVGGEKVLTVDAKPSRVIETYRSCIIRAQR